MDLFPAELAEFREERWGPVPGECLGLYSCRARGYAEDCAPPPEGCGAAHYAALSGPWQVAQARRRDARVRWRQARLAHLGEDHPAWLGEWLECFGEL